MTRVLLVQAAPYNPTTGATVAVRLAGFGSKQYTQLGFSDWRSGVTTPLRFTSLIGFDQSGWNGGALPQTGGIRFFPSDPALATALAAYYWIGASITISAGDDEAATPTYPTIFTGKVASAKVDGGALLLTISDLSTDLNKPAAPDVFAGTTGLEGDASAAGRSKRRSFGKCFNVEGRILDKANSIYEFGDPNRPLNAFTAVKDKGREGTMTTVAWAGSAIATLNALRAATAPNGGAAVAPSIACVKWWTVPVGPLTADLQGEVGTGYVNTAPDIANRLVSIYAPGITIGNLAAALAWQSGEAGVHIDGTTETVANVLDRLLLPVSTGWLLTGAGTLYFRHFAWSASVETLAAIELSRDSTFQPLRTRKVGYQRNYRQHTDAEIATSLVPDTGNLLPDPVGLSAATFANGAALDIVAGASGRLADHFRVLLDNGAGSKVFWSGPTDVAVTPGETLWYRFAAGTDVSTADTAIGGFETYGANGALISGTNDLGLMNTTGTEAIGSFDTKLSPLVVPAGVAYVRPYAKRPTDSGTGAFRVGEPLFTRHQPGADVTTQNQIAFSDVPDQELAADYTGAFASGTFPFTVSVRLLQGSVDISDLAAWSMTATGITATIDTATAGHRGDITVTAKAGVSDTVVTAKATYLGLDYFKTFTIKVKQSTAPAGGGGGGGGTPGAAASSGGPFTPAGTSATYVVAVTLPAIIVGSSGNVDLSAALIFYQLNNGHYSIGSGGIPDDVTDLSLGWERSVNGGSFAAVASPTTVGSSPAEKFTQTDPPKGARNYPGSYNATVHDTGQTSGASIVYRAKTLAVTTGVSGNLGATNYSGTLSATPL